MVSAETLRGAELGEKLLGATLYGAEGVHADAIRPMEVYLSRFAEMVKNGYGLVFSGRQGTGKSGMLALIAEAAARLLPRPEENRWGSYQKRQAIYCRMPILLRFLSDFLPASERVGWQRRYDEMLTAQVLLIDEAHVVTGDDRSCSMLLALIDTRIDARRPTYMAMNARWDSLRKDPSKLLQQMREKLSDMNREILIPGESRRQKWTLE